MRGILIKLVTKLNIQLAHNLILVNIGGLELTFFLHDTVSLTTPTGLVLITYYHEHYKCLVEFGSDIPETLNLFL